MYDADGELMSAFSDWKSAWTPSPDLNERACVDIRLEQHTLFWDQNIHSKTNNESVPDGENEAQSKKGITFHWRLLLLLDV